MCTAKVRVAQASHADRISSNQYQPQYDDACTMASANTQPLKMPCSGPEWQPTMSHLARYTSTRGLARGVMESSAKVAGAPTSFLLCSVSRRSVLAVNQYNLSRGINQLPATNDERIYGAAGVGFTMFRRPASSHSCLTLISPFLVCQCHQKRLRRRRVIPNLHAHAQRIKRSTGLLLYPKRARLSCTCCQLDRVRQALRS